MFKGYDYSYGVINQQILHDSCTFLNYIGIPRSRHAQVSYFDFLDVGILQKPAKKVATAKLRRSYYKIYLTKEAKRCLSRLSTKRLFDSRFRQKQSFMSFPLNWKKRISKWYVLIVHCFWCFAILLPGFTKICFDFFGQIHQIFLARNTEKKWRRI